MVFTVMLRGSRVLEQHAVDVDEIAFGEDRFFVWCCSDTDYSAASSGRQVVRVEKRTDIQLVGE